MPAVGGGGRGNSGRRKVVRKPKPPSRPAASFIPGAGPVVRPSRPARPQPKPKATPKPRPAARLVPGVGAVAKPSRPARPAPKRAPRAVVKVPGLGETRGAVKPLQAEPPRGIKAGKPVRTAKQRRGVAVAAYNELSGAEKHAQVRHAEKRQRQGKASETDRAILHAHKTRVAGNRQRAAASKAFDALTEPKHGLHLDPRVTLVTEPKPFRKHAGSVATLPSVGRVVAAIGPISSRGLKAAGAPKILANIPKDVGELAVTSPTGVAKFISTAVHKPGKAGKMLVEPYKELARDPKKFVTEHPVSSALMLQPAARLPGQAAGKAARLAGKQTLARPAATLPHTALKEARTGSKGAVRRAVQARSDRRDPAPKVTARELDRRADESFAAAEKHSERVQNAIMREAKREARRHPKAKRREFLAEKQSQARKAARSQTQAGFVREFAATPRVENGRIVEQPHAPTGHLHDKVEHAHAVAEHLNAKAPTIKRGHGNVLSGDPVGRLYAKEDVPVRYVVQKTHDDKFAVMPDRVAERLHRQRVVGTSKATGAKMLRQTRGMFTRAVLPYTPSWLSGQAVEGVVRSTVAGAGPTSYLRAKRVVKAMERQEPGSGKRFLERAAPGGLVGRTGMENTRKTLQEEFPESNVARALTDLGRAPGVKQVRALHHAASSAVFEHLNARFLEGVPQTAILGKALKESPLMERRVIGLSSKAIDEAARGLQGTHNQVEAARLVHRDYGKYSAYSPKMREQIMHWTPFIPWYINTARFMLSTLPKDHPLAAALVADIDAATEDWRAQQGLSLRHPENRLPSFMLGGYPINKGKDIARIGHYTPAGIGTELTGSATGLFLPQFQGILKAGFGIDWKNDPLKHPDGRPYNEGEKAIYGLTQLAEALVPLAGKASQVAEAEDKGEAARKLIRPVSVVHRRDDDKQGAVKVTPVKVKRVRVKRVRVGGG